MSLGKHILPWLKALPAALLAVALLVALWAGVEYWRFHREVRCGTSERLAMAQQIRAAEEAYRAEYERYLDVSPSDTPYPGPPGPEKRPFANPLHPDFTRWQALNIQPDGPVRCGYLVRAGEAGQPLPAGFPGPPPPATTGAGQPWHVSRVTCAWPDEGIATTWMASWTQERWEDCRR